MVELNDEQAAMLDRIRRVLATVREATLGNGRARPKRELSSASSTR
jgi:hypothetical protein